jgi:hypothetical protein
MRGRTALIPAIVAALLLAAPGAAPAHTGSPAGPVVTRPTPTGFTLPAGAVCAFAVRVDFPQHDLTRYTWNADGRPAFAMESGLMIAEFTNTATDTTVRRDLSGRGYYAYPDAQTTVLSGTRIVALLGPLDTPANQLLFSGGGFMSVRVSVVDGTPLRTVVIPSSRQENLCDTLA